MTISQAPVTLDARNRVPVEVTCPETSSGGCEGLITLSLPTGNAKVVAARRQRRIVGRSRRFRLAAGEKAVVPVALSRRGARAFRRRAPKKTRRARKLVVTVAVRTKAGIKTVTSTITVKERRRQLPRRNRR